MRKHGKKFAAARQQVADRQHTIEEAVPLIQKVKFAKFDETVELALRLGVDPKHADQMVRGTVVLPHGLGKSKKVLAIAGGVAPGVGAPGRPGLRGSRSSRPSASICGKAARKGHW